MDHLSFGLEPLQADLRYAKRVFPLDARADQRTHQCGNRAKAVVRFADGCERTLLLEYETLYVMDGADGEDLW